MIRQRTGWGVWVAAVVLCTVPLRAAGPTEFHPEIFDYDRPARLEVREGPAPKDPLAGTKQIELVFRNLQDKDVPVLLTLPEKGKGPFPVVLLIHALGSDRGQITKELAKALVDQGMACVAPDLPCHGAREGKPAELFAPDNPDQSYRAIVGAIKDIRQTIDLIKERKDLESSKGVMLIGYSLGAWFGNLAAASERRIGPVVLQAAGNVMGAADHKEKLKLFSPAGEQGLFRRYPSLRPTSSIGRVAPRPLLMQNGKKDPFISQEQAKELFRAAQAPKELRWYDSGHILPEPAIKEAAEWLAKQRSP